ncbi:MAG: FkbM family methyltransferase [Synergistaceae bacterium]|nr:FkbM family methyltransferase [Synergistaceae bacterium]
MGIMKALARKLTGNNKLIKQMVRRHYDNGHYIRAAAVMAWMFPLRKSAVLNSELRTLRFINSKEYYSELHDLWKVDMPEGYSLVRLGREHDGGYILLDDFAPGGTAYSFGISTDVSWDKDMAGRGYDVFMYDHTIDGLPEENPRFHWSKLGIADGIVQDDRLKTLDELIRTNHHEDKRNMILKMDVEGAEWGFLERVNPDTLRQFGQMTFEFHNVTDHPNPELVLEVFRKINRTHQLVHIHANNNGIYVEAGGKKFCFVTELSYVLRDKYTFTGKYDPVLPLDIDSPNMLNLQDIELGRWNERMNLADNMMSASMVVR